MNTPPFPLRCCPLSAYSSWAFGHEAPSTTAATPATVSVPPYPVGLRDFCGDCDPAWARARGRRCLRSKVLSGRLETPMRVWLRANFTMAEALTTSPIIKQERLVEPVNLLDYLGKSYPDMLRAWATRHNGLIIVFDLCRALTAVGLFPVRQEASRMFFGALTTEDNGFERVQSGVWKPRQPAG